MKILAMKAILYWADKYADVTFEFYWMEIAMIAMGK